MANPTSNFGWQMPTSTDLVTDLPADFEVFGQAVDTAMADLKGGTTGQILAKNSNTNMDFVWITNDVGDITAVTASTPLTGGGTSGAITVGIQDATTAQKGAVQLSDSTSTTSSILAATPTAVKSAFDLATTANTNSTNITMVQQYTATESVLKNIPSRVPVAEQLLKQAVYWIDAAQSDNSDQVLDNQGWGAPALTTTLGSSTSADSNDPKFLDFTGVNYVYLPGVANNKLTVPDEAALDITGDLDIRAYVANDSWTQSETFYASKYTASGNQRSYEFFSYSDGKLWLGYSINGTTDLAATSTVTTGFAAGSANWVRVTRVASTGIVKFYTSSDGITWTQLGADISGTSGNLFSSTSNLAIGDRVANTTQQPFKLYRVQILNGIGGTKVLDVDTSVIGSGNATSFNALTGQTVTINRSTTGKKTAVVTHPVWLFGTDDYMEVADNNLLDFSDTESFTMIGIVREWVTGGAFGQVLSKFDASGANAGYGLGASGTNLIVRPYVSDGPDTTAPTPGTGLTSGSLTAVTSQLDRSAQTLKLFYGATEVASGSTTAVGSLANSQTFNIGKFSVSLQPTYIADMELIAIAVFRRALTSTEISTISNYYQARVGA